MEKHVTSMNKKNFISFSKPIGTARLVPPTFHSQTLFGFFLVGSQPFVEPWGGVWRKQNKQKNSKTPVAS